MNVTRSIDKDTGEVTEVFDEDWAEAVSEHVSHIRQVQFVIANAKLIAYGEDARDLGVTQEAFDEGVKKIIGRDYKKKTWRDFLKTKV
jgi:hypothetical protein